MWTSRYACAATLFLALVASGQEPRFAVESIRVSGILWVSPEIVIAESRLQAGSSYTEAQIRDAVARVQRLPFVLDADVRLEKGAERGTYAVVLRVTETKPLFASWQTAIDLRTLTRAKAALDPVTGLPKITTEDFVVRDHVDRESIGGRFFAGSRSMFALSADIGGTDPLGAGDNRYSLAFTQYDLFGTRASVAALVQYREFTHDFHDAEEVGLVDGATTTSFGDHLIWNVTAALPLRGNQALRATWRHQQRAIAQNADGSDTFVRRSVQDGDASWVYDTTDDLLFPTSGAFAHATLRVGRASRLASADPTDRLRLRAEYFWQHEWTAGVTNYWDMTPRQSLIGGVEGLKSRNGFAQLATRAGYTASLWHGSGLGRGELRLQLEAQPTYTRAGDFRVSAHGGLAFRNVWGVARLDFSYVAWRPGNE